MSQLLEFEGKNVDQALEAASNVIGKPVEKLEYDVVSYGSSGIFGIVGAKKAKIRVKNGRPKKRLESTRQQAKKLVQDAFQLDEAPEVKGSEPPAEHFIKAMEIGEMALKRLVDFISSEAAISSQVEEQRILFKIEGGNSGMLIGKRGQTLEAIQYLVEKIVNKQNDQRVRVLVDVEGYLNTRKSNLESMAQRMAEKAQRTKKPVTIGQMNAYDRRTVHLFLKPNSAVRTQSVGEGYYRKLIIFPRKDPEKSRTTEVRYCHIDGGSGRKDNRFGPVAFLEDHTKMVSYEPNQNSDTIAAIATPVGSNGIGIIRISGEQAISAADQLFCRPGGAQNPRPGNFLARAKSHLMQYGYIFDPESRQIIDEVLVVVMRAPNSFTRENIVEIQSHSGAVILATILGLILNHGVRLAEPGEFTKRAYLNGRIDLSQAEAVADIVAAKTESALHLAANQLSGRMKEIISGIEFQIDRVRVRIEGDIEFGDEIEGVGQENDFQKIIEDNVLTAIDRLIARYDDCHVLRDGIRMDIVGKPNVGKSSLLNQLLDQDKAIVTAIPGTTRDPVEGFISVDGLGLVITDTAGMHETNDPVELAGIRKTRDSVEKSDILLFVVDGSAEIGLQDRDIWASIKHKNTILVVNKKDLEIKLKDRDIASFYPVSGFVQVSAKTGEGLDRLKHCIKETCLKRDDIEPGRTVVPNLRHRKLLETARSFIHNALKGINENQTNELVMDDLNRAKNALKKIHAGHGDEDLLDQVFGRFCIGK